MTLGTRLMTSVKRRNVLYLQIALVKQPSPVPQYGMQIINVSRRISNLSFMPLESKYLAIEMSVNNA